MYATGSQRQTSARKRSLANKRGWVYRQLRNFRAGMEAGISCLKRAYGLTRCTWRGIGHFKFYVWLLPSMMRLWRIVGDLHPESWTVLS